MLNADPKAIQQVNSTANLDQGGNATILFIIEANIIKISIA